MTEDRHREARALLTRAAELEAQRQNAVRAGHVVAVARLEEALRRLWRRYEDLADAGQ